MPIIQAYTFAGSIINQARWEVESLKDLHIDDTIKISVKSADKELLNWIGKSQPSAVGVEREGKASSYSIIMGFRVGKFLHLLENETKTMESLAQVISLNKNIEHIITYLLDPTNSDARFKALIQKTPQVSAS
jgi:hypothetical protein